MISIIIPVYNAEKTLDKCLNSILNQKFQDFELILVNDGSKDKSGEICDAYALKDKRIKVFHQENTGQSKARNFGLTVACGEYIGFIDSDDFIDERMYELLHGLMIEKNADVTSCLHKTYQTDKDLVSQPQVDCAVDIYEGKKVMEAFLKDDDFGRSPCDKLYKRCFLETIRFETGKIHEDNYFNYQIFSKINKAVHINYVGYYYFDNFESTTKKKFTAKQFDLIHEERKILKEVTKDFSELKRFEEKNIIRSYYWILLRLANDFTLIELMSSTVKPILSEARRLIKEDFDIIGKNPYISKKISFYVYLFYFMPIPFLVFFKGLQRMRHSN